MGTETKDLVYNMNLIVEIRKHASSVTLVKFQGHKIIFKGSDSRGYNMDNWVDEVMIWFIE